MFRGIHAQKVFLCLKAAFLAGADRAALAEALVQCFPRAEPPPVRALLAAALASLAGGLPGGCVWRWAAALRAERSPKTRVFIVILIFILVFIVIVTVI